MRLTTKQDWVIDLELAKELVDEVAACGRDYAILESNQRYALRVAEPDDGHGGYVALMDLWECLDKAFNSESDEVVGDLELYYLTEETA